MQTFVFDADGVICVGPSFSVCLEREHQIPRERSAPFFAGPFQECVLGRCDLKEVIAPYAHEWGWRHSVDDLLSFWFRCEHEICAQAVACVRSLRDKGHLCILATNQEKHRIEYLRRKMGLSAEFDQIFASCELGVAKPSTEFFQRIREQLNVPSGDLCLIDDSERNVAAARMSGWRALVYRGVQDLALIGQEARKHSPL